MNSRADIRPENYFHLNDSSVIKGLDELVVAMKTMNDAVFSHHVNSNRNDFSNWIMDVLKDSTLASQIAKLNSKNEIAECIKKRLAEKQRATILNNKMLVENAKLIPFYFIDKVRIINRLKEIYANV